MGAIDLPTQQWPELLPTLLQNITADTPEEVKVSTLECLGYMCERLDYKGLKKEVVNEILTAIVDGIRSDRAAAIRFAAAVALRNSLFFCRGNMEEVRNSAATTMSQRRGGGAEGGAENALTYPLTQLLRPSR